MSDALYSTRLRFYAPPGVCKRPDLCLPLATMPQIPGIEPLAGIDYVPEVAVAMLLPLRGGWREMRIEEIDAVDAYLRAVVQTPVTPTPETRDAAA